MTSGGLNIGYLSDVAGEALPVPSLAPRVVPGHRNPKSPIIAKERADEENARRLIRVATLGVAMGNMKRRLGPDATRQQLARDKRVSRKVVHRGVQFAGWWDPVASKQTVDLGFADNALWTTVATGQLALIADWKGQVADIGKLGANRSWAASRLMLLDREAAFWMAIIEEVEGL